MTKLLKNDVESLIASRTMARTTRTQYRNMLRKFEAFLKKPAKRKHLKEEVLNAFIVHLEESGLHPTTVHGLNRTIRAVWNYLTSVGHRRQYMLARLRKTRPQYKPVEAWSLDHGATLLDACDEVKGTLEIGVTGREYLRAWVIIACETGLRPSDIRRLTKENFDLETGDLELTIHKTGKPFHHRVSSTALEAIQPLMATGCDRLFPLRMSGEQRWMRKLFDIAIRNGFPKKRGQGIGALRKLHATEVCRVFGPDEAARALGHVNGSKIALTHYIGASAIKKPEFLPSITNGITRRSA